MVPEPLRATVGEAPTLPMTSTAPQTGDPTSSRTPPPRPRPHETALTPGDSARYDARFASRAAGIVSSVMRDLMSLSERPDIISLAGGFPNTEAFERAVFEEVMEVVAGDHLASSLQYGPTEGWPSCASASSR